MEQHEPGMRRRIADRDASLRRLRRTTALVFAATAALAAGFAGLAAKAFPGRSSKTHAAVVPARRTAPQSAQPVAATPPPLVSSAADAPPAPAQPPAPPPAPPVVTQAPPVAVSGGS